MAACGTLLSFTSLLSAQEFRAPSFPSPPAANIGQAAEQQSDSLTGFDLNPSSFVQREERQEEQETQERQDPFEQQRIEHSQQLWAQMERAALEQGAPAGFAEKAYRAQQAYLAEQESEQSEAYQKEQIRELRYNKSRETEPEASSSQQYEVTQADFLAPPKYHAARELANAPSTYSPPVHATPIQTAPGTGSSSLGQPLIPDTNTRRLLFVPDDREQNRQVKRVKKRARAPRDMSPGSRVRRSTRPAPPIPHQASVPKSAYQASTLLSLIHI